MDCAYPLRKGLKKGLSPKKVRAHPGQWMLRSSFRPWDSRHNVTSSVANDELHKNLRTYFDPPTLTQLPGLRRSASAAADLQSTSMTSLTGKGARRRPSRP